MITESELCKVTQDDVDSNFSSRNVIQCAFKKNLYIIYYEYIHLKVKLYIVNALVCKFFQWTLSQGARR